MKRRGIRSEAGYTLIELIVSLTILATITGATTAAFITTNNANANVSERVHESNDAQLTAGFWTADAQATGGVDASTGATDPLLGVYTTGDGGCALGGGSPALVLGFRWKEWASRQTTANGPVDTYTTRVANYVYRSAPRELERRTCSDAAVSGTLAATGSVTLATRVASAPSTACSPSNPCAGMPDTVSITVTETNDPATATTPYTFTLTASVRPGAQALPDSGNAAGSPLLALGSNVCSGNTTGLSVSGNSNVVVNGQAVINATDVGGCTAMSVNGGSIQYSADGTSLVTGGTCAPVNRCPSTTVDSTPIGNPFASLTPPPVNCAGSGNPAAGTPGIYRSPATLTGTLAPGTYIFCNTLSFSGTVTGTNVFLYFKGVGGVTIAGNVSLNISAPLTGTYAGMLLWNDTASAMTIGGNSAANVYSGTIYSPNADVTLAGTADMYVGSIVAKRILFSGTGVTSITNGSPTPGAPALTAVTGTTIRKVDLSWTVPAYTGTPGNPISGYEYRVNSGGGYGAWTAVPGGVVTAYSHTCGTSDTVPTTCTYQVRAINALGAGSASAPATAASNADSVAPVPAVSAPLTNGTVAPITIFGGTADTAVGDLPAITVKVWSGAGCTGTLLQTLGATAAGGLWSVGSNALPAGNASVCASQSDTVGNTGTSPPVNFTVDAAPPTVTAIAITNADGRIAKSDTLAITFNEAINPASLCAGWNGASRNSITVTITDNDATTGGNDSLTVTDTGCPFNFGKVNLGSPTWVTATTSYSGNGNNASTAAFSLTNTKLTITVGNGNAGVAGQPPTTMTYTPSTSIGDVVGNAMTASPYAFTNQRF